MISYLHRRRFLIMGLLLGLLIFVVLFFRQENTNSRVTRLQTQVKVIRETSPCTRLTTAECAYKLLRALPANQRQEIKVSERTLERLKRKAEAERRSLQRGNSVRGANGQILAPAEGDSKEDTAPTAPTPRKPPRTTPAPSGGSQSPSPAPSPAPASPGGSAQPASPPTATTGSPIPPPVTVPSPPAPPSAPDPIIQTPSIQTPPIGPLPPIVVPPIAVPCWPIKPLLTCDNGGR